MIMRQPGASRIAAFPKCYMDELCITHTLSLFEWIEMGATLGVEGLELYPGFFASFEPSYLRDVRDALARHDLAIPMLCASPDFIKPAAVDRRAEIDRYKQYIDLVAYFDTPEPRTCRILSGQRRPDVTEDDGVAMVVECIEQLLPYAAERRVILAIENHYKDSYWTYPEFAQQLPVFRRIVEAIDSPWFGVNYDPSNALLAGEDPLAVLDAIKHRVVSMHASDRGLKPGATLDDLRQHENAVGYASVLHHGEIGTGLNDYSTIFCTLQAVGFTGWISIEDGMDGLDELRRSVAYVRATLTRVMSATT